MNTLPLPSESARQAALSRQMKLTKPTGSLGRLEELAVNLAAWLDEPIPKSRPAAALLFAADHAVSRLGVSAYPRDVTRAMVRNFLTGGAAACVLARQLQVPLTVIDVGVDGGRPDWSGPGYVRADVADHPSGDLVSTDAMSESTLEAAILAGQSAVQSLAPDTRVVVLGEMGIGNTTVSSALVAGLVGGDSDSWVGRGTGVEGRVLAAKRDVVRRALQRVGHERSPRELLRCLGGREIAAMVGAMVESARLRRVVLVDGFIVTVAALAAIRLEPRVRPALVFAHRSAEGAHGRLLEILQARPLLDLEMRLGEGSGALVALPLLDLACRLHEEMATFESAGVPDRCD
jgi:nicotinate-nucleotide--dimethylbenzimidazole phosphoribosyltransferase